MVINNNKNRSNNTAKENIVISFELAVEPIYQIDHHTTVVDCEMFKYSNPNEIFLTTCNIDTDLYLDILLAKKELQTNKVKDFHFSSSLIENYETLVMNINNNQETLVVSQGLLTGFSDDYTITVNQEFN